MSHISQINYESASEEIRRAFDEEEKVRGNPTNMKRTLLHSVTAHAAYMQWYPLWNEVKKLLGLRAAVVFAHSISTTNDCLLCSTFFRRALADLGLKPDSFEPVNDEPLLIELGQALAHHHDQGTLSASLWERLKNRFTETELVNLIAFSGLMVATNLFNNIVQVDVDTPLLEHLPANPSY